MSELISLIRLDAFAALDAVIAAAVTVHVLLRKRDVASALGWIGLAWLSPILGGVLYFLLGINRVGRRARRFHRAARPAHGIAPPVPPEAPADPLAALDHAAQRLSGRARLTGNAIVPLHNGDEAYPPMLAAIAAARHSVALTSYILRGDAAGGAFLDALIAAAARGVAVRVLLDGIGSGYFVSPAYHRLRRAGVPCARFMHSPLPWQMPFLNLRTHKKILVVDGTEAFTGGMNIAAENVLAMHPRAPVRDTHFHVTGPVVAQLMDAFASEWSFVTGEALTGAHWFPRLHPAGDAAARVVTSGPDQDLEKIELLLLHAIGAAQRSIVVQTPYFLPNDRLTTALTLAAMRGVAVDIVQPQRGNHVLIDWASRANNAPLLQAGCRIWLNKPPFDHGKLMVVDSTWCMAGSANWDVRSLRLNFEVVLDIASPPLAAALEADMLAARGRRLTLAELDKRRLPAKLRDALARLMLPYL